MKIAAWILFLMFPDSVNFIIPTDSYFSKGLKPPASCDGKYRKIAK